MIATAENRELTFDANGNAVVSASGDEDAADMYVTVGDGTDPADPTVATNDGTISGRNGTVSTGVKITTGKEAHVKAVAADSGGVLGPVQSARQAKRQGTLGLDSTDFGTGSSTAIETARTITIPAGSLGTDGALRITAHFNVTGTSGAKLIRAQLGGTTVLNYSFTSGFNERAFLDAILTNEGAANDQRTVGKILLEATGGYRFDDTGTVVDTSVDVDLVIQIQTQVSSDEVTLETSLVELLGPGN